MFFYISGERRESITIHGHDANIDMEQSDYNLHLLYQDYHFMVTKYTIFHNLSRLKTYRVAHEVIWLGVVGGQ
jgi:hypothetical protein